jgi:hypothetical protein
VLPYFGFAGRPGVPRTVFRINRAVGKILGDGTRYKPKPFSEPENMILGPRHALLEVKPQHA